MEQVLHPDKYTRGEQPDSFEPPSVSGLSEAGYEHVFTEMLGELEMGVYFGLPTDEDLDESAAAGWSGDQLELWSRNAEHDALLWWTVWDTPAEAEEAERAAERVHDSLIEVERVASLSVRRGRALLIAQGLPTEFHGTAREALATLSATLAPAPPRRRP